MQVRPARQHRLVGHPDDRRLELVGDAAAAHPAAASTSPRLTSISSSSVSVMDWPATADVEIAVHGDDAARPCSRGPTAAREPSSPGRTVPLTIVPAETAEIEVRAG